MNLSRVVAFPKADAPIYASVVVGNVLYIGGIFTMIGGVARNRVAAIDLDTYAVLPWDPKLDINAQIRAILYSGGKIWLGGTMATANGSPVSGLAPFDPTTAVLSPGWVTATINGQVNALVDDSDGFIYAGGSFTTVGATVRNHAAAFSPTGTLQTWNPNPNAVVLCLAYLIDFQMVFLGGQFTQIDQSGTPITRMFSAAVTVANNAQPAFPFTWDPATGGPVYVIKVLSDRTILGGAFNQVNNGAFTVDNITTVDQAFAGAYVPGFLLKSVSPVSVVAQVGNSLYISNLGGPIYNGTTYELYLSGNFVTAKTDLYGKIDNGFRFDTSGSPKTFASYGGSGGLAQKLFFGGEFNLDLGNTSAPQVAVYDGAGNILPIPVGVSSAFGSATSVSIDRVNRIAYVAGNFQKIRGQNGEFVRQGLAAFALDSGNILPWAPGIVGTAQGVVFSNGTIYVVGTITDASSTVGGPTSVRGGAAAFDQAGTLLAWDPNLFGATFYPRQVIADNNYVYICGRFTQVNGGVARNTIARFDKTTGVVNAAWNPAPDSTGVSGMGFSVDGTKLYVAGSFSVIGGGAQANVGRIDLVTGANDGFAGATDFGGFEIFENNGLVYATGGFSHANGQPRTGFAIWDSAGALNPTIISPGSVGAIHLRKDTNYWILAKTVPSGFGSYDFNQVFSGVVPGLNDLVQGSDGDGQNTQVIIGGFFRARSVVDFFSALFAGDIPSKPVNPRLNFYLRKDNQTVLKWNQVFMDVLFARVKVDGYRVYRSSNENLETYELVKEITTTDVLGVVDTMFTELIQGFYAYRVTAFKGEFESDYLEAKAVNSPFGADFL